MGFFRVVLLQRTMIHYRADILLRLQKALDGGLCVITCNQTIPGSTSPFYHLPKDIPHFGLKAKFYNLHLGI
jgi:hypothetical protein